MKTIEAAIKYVEEELNIELQSKLNKKKKTNELVMARAVVYYIATTYLKMRDREIAKYFNKNRVTIYHSNTKILPQIKTISKYRDLLYKVDNIYTTAAKKETLSEEIQRKLDIDSLELENINLHTKNDELEQKVQQLEREIVKLKKKLSLLPESNTLLEYLERTPKSRRALAEENILKVARLAYNG